MSKFAGLQLMGGKYVLWALIAAVVAGCGGGVDVQPLSAAETGTQTETAPPAADHPPTIYGSPVTIAVVGTAYSFQPGAADADGDSLTFAIENKPAWATFDASSGLLSGVPSADDVGTTAAITISVSDAKAAVELAPFQIQVTTAAPPPNSPPTISGQPATTGTVGLHYVFQPSASDPNGAALTFSITGKPAWATFNTASGQLSGTPASADAGTSSNIVISVSDGQDSAALPAFDLKIVAASNHAPTLSGSPPTTVAAGSKYWFQPSASDADGDAVTFMITNKPSWATFSPDSGLLSGTPGPDDVGKSAGPITITASDGKASATLPAFTITVTSATVTPPPNSPPTISGAPGTTVTVGTQYSFQPSASDADGDDLTFSISHMPPWATFNAATGQLKGTPTSGNVGTYSNIVISVSDGTASTSLAAFTLQVNAPPNHAPTISGTPATQVQSGQSYAFTPSAQDADGDSLAFSIQNKPSWAAFSTSSGKLSGTPTAAGTFSNIVISVSDGKATTPLAGFAITVTAQNPPANNPPSISGSPATSVVAGAAYSFKPTASDPDGDSLTFSIQNKPGWASFSTSNGTLTGTPSTANAGSYANIVISASDGQATRSLAAFTITVTTPNPPANNPPSISGSPATSVVAGTAYHFTPTASDPDGDSLTFSIQNKPSWASFSTSTGALTGTPSSSNTGSFSNIVISVSDGKVSKSLAAFTLTVTSATVVGSAVVKWAAPTTNSDGTPVTGLAGYVIQYGNSANLLSQKVDVGNPSATSYTINGLGSGTWYFAVVAYSNAGEQSSLSDVVSKTIQ